MNIYLHGELDEQTIVRIFPDKTICPRSLNGYASVIYERKSYIKKDCNSCVYGFVIELDSYEIWKMDQWKNVFISKRMFVPEINAFAYMLLNEQNIYGFNNIGDSPYAPIDIIPYF